MAGRASTQNRKESRKAGFTAASKTAARIRADVKTMIAMARRARDFAFAPFSRFKVGAAIRTRDGRIYTGCNIENASFSLTLCAERVAAFKAISEGVRDIRQVAIVTDARKLTPPCGACRQILWEFAPHAQVILANVRGRMRKVTVAKLIPQPFDASDLT